MKFLLTTTLPVNLFCLLMLVVPGNNNLSDRTANSEDLKITPPSIERYRVMKIMKEDMNAALHGIDDPPNQPIPLKRIIFQFKMESKENVSNEFIIIANAYYKDSVRDRDVRPLNLEPDDSIVGVTKIQTLGNIELRRADIKALTDSAYTYIRFIPSRRNNDGYMLIKAEAVLQTQNKQVTIKVTRNLNPCPPAKPEG